MSETNVALARRWFNEVWNQKETGVIAELLTEESVCHAVTGGEIRGRAAFENESRNVFLSAFPDLNVAIEDLVAQGDHVVIRWRATGTHTGTGLGIPPSNRPIDARGMTWIRFQDGKMMEGWDCWNLGGLIQSLQAPA